MDWQLLSFRDPVLGAGRESILPMVVMDFRARSFHSRPGMTSNAGRKIPDFSLIFIGRREVPAEFGWIATLSKPRFQANIKLMTFNEKIWGYKIWSQP
jgi:hypothetical protein